MTIKSQNQHDSISHEEMARTTVDRKEDGIFLVTGTMKSDGRGIVLGRYPTSSEAHAANDSMWNFIDCFRHDPLPHTYQFPPSSDTGRPKAS